MNIQITKTITKCSKCSTSVAGSLLHFLARKIKLKCIKYNYLVNYYPHFLPSVACVARFLDPFFNYLFFRLLFNYNPLFTATLATLAKNCSICNEELHPKRSSQLLHLCYGCYTF